MEDMTQVRRFQLSSVLGFLIAVPAAIPALFADANLAPYQPPGWSDKIVVTDTAGRNSDYSALNGLITVQWAVINSGSSQIEPSYIGYSFVTRLCLDDRPCNVLNEGRYAPGQYCTGNMYKGRLDPGLHTISVRVDANNQISESNENDNFYSKTFLVMQPNLTPYQPTGWDDKIVVSKWIGGNLVHTSNFSEHDVLYIGWQVINQGSEVGKELVTELYVDGTLVGLWTRPYVSAEAVWREDNIYLGTLSAGFHTLTIKTDARNAVQESNEGDNEYTRTILVAGNTLALRDSRFTVEADWRTAQGASGKAVAVRVSNDSGYFWFFGPENMELFVKLLDGRGVNGYFWFFYGALTDIEYTLTVTDTQTGTVRTYFNPQGVQAGGHDTAAFAGSGSPSSLFSAYMQPLLDLGPAFYARDRFKIEVTWTVPGGASGIGTAVPLTSDSGYFWFFDSSNVELVVKVVDGRGVNSHFWFFYGSLTDIRFTVTVTDTTTGASRVYQGQQGVQQSGYDLSAF